MKIILKSNYLFPSIKLNYNCSKDEKSGEGPGSCKAPDKKVSIKTPKKSSNILSNAEKLVSTLIQNKIDASKTSGKSYDDSTIKLKNVGMNLLGAEMKVSASDDFIQLAKSYGISDMDTLDISQSLINGISTGSDNIFAGYDVGQVSREHIYDAFKNSGDLKKALDLRIAVETLEFSNKFETQRKVIELEKKKTTEIEQWSKHSIEKDWIGDAFAGGIGSKYVQMDMSSPGAKAKSISNLKKAFDDNINSIKEKGLAPRMLYRKGGYHENSIESYTTNPEGAEMAWMTKPGKTIGVDFKKSFDELQKDGWKVLAGANEHTGYVGEDEVILINMNDIKSGNIKRTYKEEDVRKVIKDNKDRAEKLQLQYNDIHKQLKVPKVESIDNPIVVNSKPTDITKTKTFQDYLDKKVEDHSNLENPLATNLGIELGYGKFPRIVSSNDINKLESKDNQVLYIGMNSSEHSNQFKNARYSINTGTRDAYEAYTNIANAVNWDSNDKTGVLIRAVLSKDAKIIDSRELEEKTNEFIDGYKEVFKKQEDEIYDQIKLIPKDDPDYKTKADIIWNKSKEPWLKSWALERAMKNNKPIAAMVLGYDAIKDDINNKISVVNRGALYVDNHEVPAVDFPKLDEVSKIENRIRFSSEMIDDLKKSGKHLDWLPEEEASLIKNKEQLASLKKEIFKN